VDQVAPHDLLVRDVERGVADGDRHPALAGGDDLAPETGPARDLVPGAQRHPAAYRAREVRGLAQRPLGPRRGDVDAELAAPAVEQVRDALAERVVDPVRVVDVNADPLRRDE